MNHQSDYGYSIGGIEHRTPELCLRRAADCDRLAKEQPEKAEAYRKWAAEWRSQASARPW